MGANVKFPNPTNTATLKAEPDQRIVVMTNATVIPAGGVPGAGNLVPWKKAYPASVYKQFVLEIMGSSQMTLNDGTVNSGLGLYGSFLNAAGVTEIYLLGVVGYATDGTPGAKAASGTSKR